MASIPYNIRMMIRTLLFDLDDTLYDSSSGLWDAIRQRMNLYMHERVGLSWEVIPALRKEYYVTFGTTLRGLQHYYQVDAEDYLTYVHDLPVEEYIRPDPHLRDLLNSLPQKRWIFTNADAVHARRVLNVLELEGCFSGVIDVRAIDYACKPEPRAYLRALDLCGELQPEHCAVFDDSVANLQAAGQLGFATILVGSSAPNDGVTCSLLRISELPQAMPELWTYAANNVISERKS